MNSKTKNATGALMVSEELVAVPGSKKNQYEQCFVAGQGEIVVHLSNFTKSPKHFRIRVEEVDAEGNPVKPAEQTSTGAEATNSNEGGDAGAAASQDTKTSRRIVKKEGDVGGDGKQDEKIK